jgi:hypothetical protein
VHFCYGPMTRSHPRDGFVDRLQEFGLPPPCYPSYEASDSYLGGSSYCLPYSGMRSRKYAQTLPSPAPVALLLIDVLTTFQFPDGDPILRGALAMRDALMRLKARARRGDIPVLCVNDNFGDWRSEKEVPMGRCWNGANTIPQPGL